MKIRKPLKDDWATPKEFIVELEKEFGKMFDPCPLHSNFDGLSIPWKEVNFVNPPYSRKLKEAFITKAYQEWQRNNRTSILLLPVSTSTKIFHRLIYPYAEIRFIEGRIKFNGLKTAGQMDNMLVIYRSKK